MKRQFLSLIIVLSLALSSYANHITGGEMSYSLVSQSGNNYTYAITLKLFRDATSATALDPFVNIAIYSKANNALVYPTLATPPGGIAMATSMILTATPGPCIVNPPIVSYQVGFYNLTVTLPGSAFGYVITYARCCRVAGITNISPPSTNFGATYTAEIPGNSLEPTGPANNSARFLGIDTVIICAGYPFTYNFGATDPDGDFLTYGFMEAYTNTGGTVPNPPAAPPYIPLNYNAPYSPTSPMGNLVTIDPNTGVISGTAPQAGIYVVTVYVREMRNGELIGTQRKDLQVKVADCDVATVTLEPNGYINCNDFTMTFSNLSPSSLINTYFWDFGDLATLADTSHLASPTYTYPDTGIYTVKIVANRNAPCSDSTIAQVRVYPGFFPNFSHTGMCMNTPVQFQDLSAANYGSVNFWRYDFGVTSILNDTSRLRNPQYTYTAVGSYTAEFIVGTSKGCRDTIYQTVDIIDKPPITMAFRDTLICNDTIQLNATGNGAIAWTPNYNITNSTSVSPSVHPLTTTWYFVDFNDNGCRNRDSVRVRVVNSVNLTASNDTTICANDAVQLFANTDGFQYSWQAVPSLSNPNILNPIATPVTTTNYQVTAIIGGCTATENVLIIIAPRPTVNAGSDVDICYNSTAQLNAQTNGTAFTWSNAASLSDAAVLNPIATPTNTTTYILTATDNTPGVCPKPSSDSVIVRVLPKVKAFAGNDTVIIASLPLQLKATGGVNYQWSPATGLNNPNIAGPIASLDGNPEYVTYMVTVTDQAGCFDTSSITIRVYKTGPDIFVPTGFTPDGNGRNDVFRPIYVGMKAIDYFRVYNRWGKLIYSNNKNDGQGWDGTINGIKQNTGTFIWMVRATDIINQVHFKKGTVMLIR